MKNDQFFKNSLTLQERNHFKEMVLLNWKKVHPDHDNIRYTDLKAPMGFEPMTSCLLDRRSNHLSYGALLKIVCLKMKSITFISFDREGSFFCTYASMFPPH